jgi:hypothetical protein
MMRTALFWVSCVITQKDIILIYLAGETCNHALLNDLRSGHSVELVLRLRSSEKNGYEPSDKTCFTVPAKGKMNDVDKDG